MTSTELATTTPPQEPWRRRKGETAQAYHAFNLYRNLPPPRTIREAARIEAESGRKRATIETLHTRFRGWAAKWEWAERADLFDAELDRQRLAARETERQRIDREQMLEGRFLRQSAILRLTGGEDSEGEPVERIDLNEIPADLVLSMYRTGVQTERQAAGLAIGQALGMIPLAHARQIIEEVFQAALDFIPDDRKQAYVVRVQSIAEGR